MSDTTGVVTTKADSPAGVKKRQKFYHHRFSWQLGNWAFLVPHLAFFLLFAIIPLLAGTVMSLHNWSLLGSRSFIGFENYTRIWADQRFWTAVKNTVIFALISVPLVIIVGMILATILKQQLYGKLWLLVCFVSPTFFASVGVLRTWQWMFSSTQSGLVNFYLMKLGILKQAISWFQTTAQAWAVIILATVWWIVGFSVLLYIGALQRVPPEQYEAARIDGAGPIRRFVSITLPWIRNVLFFDLVRQVLLAFGLFDQIFFLTTDAAGGPAGTTRTMVFYLYLTGFNNQALGRAAAISWYIFFIIAAFGLIQLFGLTRSVKSAEG